MDVGLRVVNVVGDCVVGAFDVGESVGASDDGLLVGKAVGVSVVGCPVGNPVGELCGVGATVGATVGDSVQLHLPGHTDDAKEQRVVGKLQNGGSGTP